MNKSKSAIITAPCGDTSSILTFSSFTFDYSISGGCAISADSTKTLLITVVALDGSTTKTYQVDVTRGAAGSVGGQSQPSGQVSATTVISKITGTSTDVNFSTLAAAQSGVSTWNARLFIVVGSTSTFLNSRVALSSWPSVSLTGLTPGTTYSIFFGNPNHRNGVNLGYEPGQRFTILSAGGGSSSPSVDLVALQAAAAVAITAAKTRLVDTLKAGKPLTASNPSAADIPVVSAKASDRVNAKILALPVDKRADLSTVATPVHTENFVDRVSNESTKVLVRTCDIVAEKPFTSDNQNNVRIFREILKQDANSLDSIEKVAAAVTAATAKIQARKDRTLAIIAKIKGLTVK